MKLIVKPILLSSACVLLGSSGAFAQANVTVYGAVDAAYNYYSSEGISKSGMGNSQLSSAKLGFSGTEDLGGGLKAIFKLEGGLANDSGTGKASNTNNQVSGAAPAAAGGQGFVFQRYAYVGLSGGWGELRLGRDYTAAFRAVSPADPFVTNGPADLTTMALNLGNSNKQATTSNASNMIGYYTPPMNGFNATAQVFLGESASNAVNANDGDGYSIRVGYTKGPWAASLGTQTTRGTVTATTLGDYSLSALSLTYDLGVAKLAFTSSNETLVKSAVATASNNSNMLGVTVPLGAAKLKASYVRASQNTGVAGAADTSGTLYGLGVDYDLSKRTTVYATYASVANGDGGKTYSAGNAGLAGTIANNRSSGLALGVFHAF